MTDLTAAQLVDKVHDLSEVHAGKGILARIYEKPDKVHNETRDALADAATLIEQQAERIAGLREIIEDIRKANFDGDSGYPIDDQIETIATRALPEKETR